MHRSIYLLDEIIIKMFSTNLHQLSINRNFGQSDNYNHYIQSKANLKAFHLCYPGVIAIANLYLIRHVVVGKGRGLGD